MENSIEHGGPDAHGSYVRDGVSLGHRRLSIMDLSESGQQPLANEDDSVWVVFNGEIYNYPELRERLESLGHVFRSHSDTEAIVHAYEEYGDACVEHLIGMFAFAIYDESRQRFFLARDRIGIRPLYYHFDQGRPIFASKIKAILCSPEVERSIDPQALFDLMGYEFSPAPRALVRGSRKLLPGHTLILERGGKTKISLFWSLEVKTVDPSGDALLDLFERVCSDHMMSDVPVGAFLPGGIDSSSVVHFVASAAGEGLQKSALGYADESFSEFNYARRVAEHYRTKHAELMIPPVSPKAINHSIHHLGEPMTDLSNLPFMLICGKAANRLASLPIPFRQTLYRGVIAALKDNDQEKGAQNIAKRFLQGAVFPRHGEHMRWKYFMNPERDGSLFRREVLQQVDTDPFLPIATWSSQAPPERARREEFVELNTILPDSVLMKVDKMSMAHSLEVQVPFLDHRVIEHCYSLPSNLKLKGYETKWIFKEAMQKRLLPGIARRGKQGFSFPIKNWIRGDLASYTREESFASPAIKNHFDRSELQRLWNEHQASTHSHLLWTLLNIRLRGKMWHVS